MPIAIDQLVLEGRISQPALDTLRSACTAGWDPAFVSTDQGLKAGEDVVFRRHDQTVRHILPWLDRHIDFSSSEIVDFGAGCGSSSLAFSKVAKRVHSFEIDEVSCEAFRKRMEIFKVQNVEFIQCPPETIFENAAAVIGGDTNVMLVAVVEHLLEQEQIKYLKAFWDRLAPGQVLAIMETPNYLAYFDTHTFQKPFAHFVPDEMFSRWLEKQPAHTRFRDGLLERAKNAGNGALLEQRRRLGLGVTSEPFEQAFGVDLNELVVGDGFDDEMLAWFPIVFDDRILLSAFDHYDHKLPVGFAKNVLSFIFKKPESVASARSVAAWNEERRRDIIERFSGKF